MGSQGRPGEEPLLAGIPCLQTRRHWGTDGWEYPTLFHLGRISSGKDLICEPLQDPWSDPPGATPEYLVKVELRREDGG